MKDKQNFVNNESIEWDIYLGVYFKYILDPKTHFLRKLSIDR